MTKRTERSRSLNVFGSRLGSKIKKVKTNVNKTNAVSALANIKIKRASYN